MATRADDPNVGHKGLAAYKLALAILELEHLDEVVVLKITRQLQLNVQYF